MARRKTVIDIACPIFAAGTFATLVGGILSGAMDYFYLSMFIGLPFLFGLALAARTRSDLLIVVALAAFISGWLGPLGLFLDRDKYTYSGFLAVKDFHFSVFEFIASYLPIIAGYFVIMLIAVFFSGDVAANARAAFAGEQSRYPAPDRSRKRQTAKGSGGMRILFVAMILGFAAVNWWMFNNSVGLTGINPPELPFKLSGILYYLSRFVFPAALIFLLTKFKPSSADLALLTAYACFAALTSVSKTTLFLMFTPVLISSFLQRRYVLLAVALLLLAIFYPVVNVARNFVYLSDQGVSVRNLDFSIVQVLVESLFEYTGEDLMAGPLSIVERIGGGQDVALAAQYDSAQVAGPLVEFVRVYIFDFFDLAATAQAQMYDYQPDILGFATGDGGFFAHMLLVGGGSFPVMLLVCAYEGMVLTIGNSTYQRLLKLGIPREVVLFYAVLFCILFFALSIPLWLNVFALATFAISRTRMFASFVRSRQQGMRRSIESNFAVSRKTS
jgi:hypothetical protein